MRRRLSSRSTGAFRSGLRHGHGVQTYADDSHRRAQYAGEWAAGVESGRGKLEFVDGSFYEGEFARGLYDGRGEWHAADGVVYAGRFAQNLLVDGTVRRPDGSVYTGQLRAHRPHGRGRLVRGGMDGSTIVYDGQWHDGVRHGAGSLTTTSTNGTITATPANQAGSDSGSPGGSTCYTGMFSNNQPHGRGTLVYANGNTYAGEFAGGAPHGRGRLVYARAIDGSPFDPSTSPPDSYEGVFERGVSVPLAVSLSASALALNTNTTACATDSVTGTTATNVNWRLAALVLAARGVREAEAAAAAEVERRRSESIVAVQRCAVCHTREINTLLLDCAQLRIRFSSNRSCFRS